MIDNIYCDVCLNFNIYCFEKQEKIICEMKTVTT